MSSSSSSDDGSSSKSGEDEAAVSIESGGDASDSDSSSSEEEKKKKKKDKKAKKKKDKDKKKDKKKAKKDKKGKKDKKAAKKKKDKKDKKKPKKGKGGKEKANRDAVSQQFGKYGIIKAEDFFNKKPEFLLWAMEVKKSNTDAMGQMQMKDLFKEYIEDYNTATMPSKKYYNLEAWDRLQTNKRAKKIRGDDMTEAQKAALASFDDERARREEIKHLQARKQEAQINDEVRRMRMDKSKVDEMKHQQMLRTQMDVMNKSGFSKEASKIAERLDPSRPD